MKFKILRISPRGLEFNLTQISETQTLAEWNGKSVIIDLSIESISQCWYNWQMKGLHIQDAFSMISNEEREFLLTGITPKEWNEMFSSDEKDDE